MWYSYTRSMCNTTPSQVEKTFDGYKIKQAWLDGRVG